MAWRRVGDKPLSEPMTFSLLTHINASLGPNQLNTTTKLYIIIVSTHQRVKFTRNRHPRSKANAHVAQRVNITQLRGFKAIVSSWHNYWGPGLKWKIGLYIRPNDVSGRLIFSYPCHCATTYRSRTNRPTGCQLMVGWLVGWIDLYKIYRANIARASKLASLNG